MVKNNDQVSRDILSEDKVYEMGVLTLNNTYNRIDNINKFYFSMSASFAVAVPFIINFLTKASESIGLDQSTKNFFINYYIMFIAIFGYLWWFHSFALRLYAFSLENSIIAIEKKHSKSLFLYEHPKNKILYYIDKALNLISRFFRLVIPSLIGPLGIYCLAYILKIVFIVSIP